MTARALVVRALVRLEQGGYANLVLDAELQKHPLEARERAFASAVFYTTVEHRITADYILEKYSKKKLSALDPEIRAILRSGLAQVRWLQTPASAAVNEAVKLTRAVRKASAAGMVNAVLRRAAAFSGDLAAESFATPAERLSVLCSVAMPVAELFLRCYPQDAQAILEASAPKSETALRVNTLRTGADTLCEALRAEGTEARPGPFPGCVLARFSGSPAGSHSFQRGFYHVEGQTSQLAALAVEARSGQTVVDLCAAPGGKTLTLAQQMGDSGRLYACDAARNRLSLIEAAVGRQGLHCVTVIQNDAAVPNPLFLGADRILADVPCSGLGVLGKKPDLRYKELDSLPRLVALQAAILESAAASLGEGGRLVYSTCTLNPAENEEQIRRFLSEHPAFRVTAALPDALIPPGMRDTGCGLLSLPHETGLDGFFICAMEKTA